MDEDIKGLTVIFTGPGKGKTSAGFGVLFRAAGHGMGCHAIQFIKGNRNSGELRTAEKLGIPVEQMGKGFTWLPEYSLEQHKEAAAEGYARAKELLASGIDVLLLDEILYALGKELVTEDEVLALMETKPEHTHLILTGRGATERLTEKADMVSTIEATKHPYQAGIPAQKGVDF